MNQKDFNQTVKARIRQTQDLLLSKGKEYADADRLGNFKEGAAYQRITPQQCLMGYVTKHLVAIVEFNLREARGEFVSHEQWDEKIGDVIVYMHLLEALVVEDLHETPDV